MDPAAMDPIVNKKTVLDEFERQKARSFELSAPEIAERVARRLSLPVEAVLAVINQHQELRA